MEMFQDQTLFAATLSNTVLAKCLQLLVKRVVVGADDFGVRD